MKAKQVPLPESVRRELILHFPRLATGEWPLRSASGLRGISVRSDGGSLIEIVCAYRDQREEFLFVTTECPTEKAASTLVQFIEMLLRLPKDALATTARIRDVLNYETCTAIY